MWQSASVLFKPIKNHNNELCLHYYNNTTLRKRQKRDNYSNLVNRVQHWYGKIEEKGKNNQNFWKDKNLWFFKIEFLFRIRLFKL